MQELLTIIIFGTLIEGIVGYVTELFQNKKIDWKKILALVIGIALAVVYKLDFLSILGIAGTSELLIVNFIITGIIISRGSNYIFDVFKLIKGAKDKIIEAE